jgi:hypothetical protein
MPPLPYEDDSVRKASDDPWFVAEWDDGEDLETEGDEEI